MTTPLQYAVSAVRVLREHFPGLADPDMARIVTTAIEQQALHPRASFEVIIDDPIAANWRLKPNARQYGHVRLACYRISRRDADNELERAVNDALNEMEAEETG